MTIPTATLIDEFRRTSRRLGGAPLLPGDRKRYQSKQIVLDGQLAARGLHNLRGDLREEADLLARLYVTAGPARPELQARLKQVQARIRQARKDAAA